MNSSTSVVRSNQNAVMTRTQYGSDAFYTIVDLKSQSNAYSGTLNACKKAWNKHYANSRQFIAKGNHRYL